MSKEQFHQVLVAPPGRLVDRCGSVVVTGVRVGAASKEQISHALANAANKCGARHGMET